MALHSPVHPGKIVRERIEALGLPVGKVVEALGVNRSILQRVMAGTIRVSPETALRLEVVLGLPAEELVTKQAVYDVYLTRATRPEIIEGLQRAPVQFPQQESQPCP